MQKKKATACGGLPNAVAPQAARSALIAYLLIAAARLIIAGHTFDQCRRQSLAVPDQGQGAGVGLPYAVAVSKFGGTAESIALSFKTIGDETRFYYHLTAVIADLTAVIATSLVVYTAMRDTKHASAIGRHV